jgi:malonate transporter
MLSFLATSFPFFAVIFLGWFAGRRGLFAPEAVRILNTFAFVIATPALIIRVVAAQPIVELWNGAYFAVLACVGVGLSVSVRIASRALAGTDAAEATSLGQSCVGPNFAFLGVPLALAFLGEKAAGPIAMGLLCDNAIIIASSIGILEAIRGGGKSFSAIARDLCRGVLLNPFMLSIAAGMGLSMAGIVPSGPFDRFLEFLGSAAPPAGVFALGLALSGWSIRGTVGVIVPLSTIKLVLHPFLIWLALGPVLGLDPFWQTAGVLYAALPTAANVFIIAERYGSGSRVIAAVVLVTTVLATFTFPTAVWLVSR